MSTHLSTDQLLHAYTVMRTIRDFEERLHVEFATGEIPGFVHLYAGQEASAAPAANGAPAPTMPLAPSMPFSWSAMCMEPPLPPHTPVFLP